MRLRWILSTGAIRAANALLGVINAALLARLLGVSEYGQYAFVFALMHFLSVPTSMGIPQLVIRETAYAKEEGNPSRILGVWRWASRTILASSGIMVLLAASLLLLAGAAIADAENIFAGLLLIPLFSFGNLRGAALRGLGKVVQGQFPEMILRPAFFVLVLLAFWLADTHKTLSALDALLLQAGAALAAFVIGSLVLASEVRKFGKPTPEKVGGKGMYFTAMSLGLVAGLTAINNNIDIVMIRFFMTDADVGIYRPASTLAGFVLFGLQIINVIIMPQIAALYKSQKIAALEALVKRATLWSFGYGLVGLAAVFFFGEAFIRILFGAEYVGGYQALLILATAQTLNSSFGAAANLLNMSGFEKFTLRSIAAAVCVNIVTNAILIQFFGINGAAFGTLIAVLFYKRLLSRAIVRELGIKTFVF